MATPNHTPQHSRLASAVLIAGLLVLSAIYATWVWSNTLTDLGGDSAAYLIISRLYSPYHAASEAVLAYKNGIISPPLFPLFLAIADGGYHLLAAHLVVAAFAVASTVMLYCWLRKETLEAWAAAAIALLVSILPITLFTVFNIWTEFPYLFFSLATIAALAAGKEKPLAARAWYLAAAMVACACLIRVAALPLLAAFLLYLLLQRPANLVRYGLLAILPFGLWEVYSSLSETGAGSYVDQLVKGYSGDFLGKLVAQCRGEYSAVFSAWKMGWIQFSSSTELHAIIEGFWYLCLAGWLFRLARLRFDAIYVLIYLIQLFIWPHPEEASRYSFVLFPVFIASGFLLVAALPKPLSRPSGKPYTIALAIGVMFLTPLSSLGFDIDRFLGDIPPEIESARHTMDWYVGSRPYAAINARFASRLTRHLVDIDRYVAPNQCIFAIKAPIVTLLSDRVSTMPPAAAENDAQFNAGIAKCRYAYVISSTSRSFPQMYYPKDRLGARAKILSRFDDDGGDMDGALLEISP